MIHTQLRNAQRLLSGHLGDTLQAIHLYGSAVAGGLKPQSDLDLRALEVTLLVRDDIHPWRYPPRRELQFGEWLREPLLSGAFEPAQIDPILLTKTRQHSLCLLEPPAAQWFDPVPARDLAHAFSDTLAQWSTPDDWAGDECTVALALARIWYSLATGEIAAKDKAADWLLAQLPAAHRQVLANARDTYLGEAPERLGQWPEQVAAFVHYCKAHIPRHSAARQLGVEPSQLPAGE